MSEATAEEQLAFQHLLKKPCLWAGMNARLPSAIEGVADGTADRAHRLVRLHLDGDARHYWPMKRPFDGVADGNLPASNGVPLAQLRVSARE